MLRLLKSMNRLADEADLFKSFCGAPANPSTELLSKMKWYNGTVMPYYYTNSIQNGKKLVQQHNERQTPSQKDIMKYCGNVMANIANNANNKQLCCIDFLINDAAKTSLKQALIPPRRCLQLCLKLLYQANTFFLTCHQIVDSRRRRLFY